MEAQLVSEFKKNALFRLQESNRMVTIAMEKLKEEDLWKRPNNSSNSVGNLLLHLCGNITQYAIHSLGNLPDTRVRDEEFSATDGYSKKELTIKLLNTVDEAKQTIEGLSTAELVSVREVQGFQFSGIGIIMHVVEHYSYHTGQIAFWVKQLEGDRLGFYDGIDLNIKNK